MATNPQLSETIHRLQTDPSMEKGIRGGIEATESRTPNVHKDITPGKLPGINNAHKNIDGVTPSMGPEG